jgi:putative protease
LEGAKFAKECGFSRVILARETPLAEIAKITAYIETEIFVQGALCTCFSGQCYFSSFTGGNSGNRGRCKQPCRKQYAYNRNGNAEKNYALSLSDLCVGEDIQKLIDVGVVSFKIEGRMRRAEYVGAAVRYYRAILDEAEGIKEALSDLKRAYNRGNYTKGLAFGQDKRFLSPVVQGHLGEKVGVVKVINGKFYVESLFKPRQGDAFKILRDGKELGGAIYVKTEGKSFIIGSKIRLKNGDSVFVTTDSAVNERVLQAEKAGNLNISLRFIEGENPIAKWGDICLVGETTLQSAQNRPLSREELENCFRKTDGLPVKVTFEEITLGGNIFIPKSELNAFRREFYAKLADVTAKHGNVAYECQPISFTKICGNNDKTAVIATDFTDVSTDIAIYKADDLRSALPESFTSGKFEKYLYYPPFATEQDLLAMDERVRESKIDGIYVENYGGIVYARERNLKIFAGTGLNLINQLSINAFLVIPKAEYYAISKEANAEEARALVSEKAFLLSSGGIKIMDLCYCPFGKTCSVCDKKSVYTLTDESGREFPVRRYVAADGNCRFEVYNCADLIGIGLKNAGALLDLTLVKDKQLAVDAKDNELEQKKVYKNYTSGHLKRGVL